MDRIIASLLVLVTSPALVARGLIAYARAGRVFAPVQAVGRGGRRFGYCAFADSPQASGLLHVLAVARGKMRFVGPRPLFIDGRTPIPEQERWRLKGDPGLFSVHRLRESTGIAYEEERAVDEPHLEDQSLLAGGNLSLVLRSLLARRLRGHESLETPHSFSLLGVDIANDTMAQSLDWIARRAPRGEPGAGGLVCFVNPGCLNIAVEDPAYRAVVQGADRVLPDGIGLKVAARTRGIGLRENVNGTDMFPRLCRRAADDGLSLFLLGAADGVARAAADAMCAEVPGLHIAGTHHGFFADDEDDVIAEINASGADILLVAMGVPQQELWLSRVRDRLTPGVAMGVGGLFDFYSGRIPRAPAWMREIGLEWVWRLAQEPGRMWRRYIIGNPLFLFRVWRETRGTPAETPVPAPAEASVSTTPAAPSPTTTPMAPAAPAAPVDPVSTPAGRSLAGEPRRAAGRTAPAPAGPSPRPQQRADQRPERDRADHERGSAPRPARRRRVARDSR